jgi:hypothetical protein
LRPPVPSVIGKYRRAVVNQKESTDYFDVISNAVDEELLVKWEAEIKKAESGRVNKPEMMDIMANKLKTGTPQLFKCCEQSI